MGLTQRNNPGCRWTRTIRAAILVLACLPLANCVGSGKFARSVDPKYGVASSPRMIEDGENIPKGGGYYRVGKPYTIGEREYVPEHDPQYAAEGIASWYGDKFHGRLTANGEIFDKESISAAHTTMPIPSYARVTNLANRRSIIVRVNDRGPFHSNRIIDLSARTADMLGFRHNGVARVRVEYVGSASLQGSDDMRLASTLRTDGSPAPAPSNVRLASGGPFVPNIASPLPAGRRLTAQVPEPLERPFDIGRYPQGAPTPVRYEASEPPVVMASAGSYERRIPTQASFSPGHPRPVDSPIASGRGLY
jgi:rare lipoprotein A